MKSFLARPQDVQRKWFVVDAGNEILGRMATKVAQILMGKHKPSYTPHIDTGDYVIITNASKVQVTGKKLDQEVYRYHTQRPGNLKETPMRKMMEFKPEEVVRLAIRRMLPKTKLGRHMLAKLKVFRAADHTHAAQKPEPLAFKTAK